MMESTNEKAGPEMRLVLVAVLAPLLCSGCGGMVDAVRAGPDLMDQLGEQTKGFRDENEDDGATEREAPA